MTDDLRPLYLYSPEGKMPERFLQAIRDTKTRLGLPYEVKPVQAVYGQPGRVLCHKEHVPFLAESVIAESPADMTQKLLWALGETEYPHSGVIEKLSDWLGAEVTELEPEEIVSKVRFG